MTTWFIYIIETRHGEYYTGITTDVDRRLKDHQEGHGAKYLRGRGPLTLIWRSFVGGKGDALRLERRIKSWPRAKKRLLISGRISPDGCPTR